MTHLRWRSRVGRYICENEGILASGIASTTFHHSEAVESRVATIAYEGGGSITNLHSWSERHKEEQQKNNKEYKELCHAKGCRDVVLYQFWVNQKSQEKKNYRRTASTNQRTRDKVQPPIRARAAPNRPKRKPNWKTTKINWKLRALKKKQKILSKKQIQIEVFVWCKLNRAFTIGPGDLLKLSGVAFQVHEIILQLESTRFISHTRLFP